MLVAAIITEYNPFHNGHLYQINKIKELLKVDYIIAIMSGDYVQRGAPALLEKHIRTDMALSCGVDLVLELPMRYASSSAKDFADGAISILASLGVVDYLCFGSEDDDISLFYELGTILESNDPIFDAAMAKALKSGCSYPRATESALSHTLKELHGDKAMSDQRLATFLNGSNNTLGLAYIRALIRQHVNITPFIIKRSSDNYNSLSTDDIYASATAIRNNLLDTSDVSSFHSDAYTKHIPPQLLFHIEAAKLNGSFLYEDDFSVLLKYALLFQTPKKLQTILGISEDLANKIYNNQSKFTTFTAFIELLKAKNNTYAGLSRCLLHTVLRIGQTDTAPSSIRILGFCKCASPLLSAIKSSSSMPLISKLADAKDHSWDSSIKASNLYHYLCAKKTGKPPIDERSLPIVIR